MQKNAVPNPEKKFHAQDAKGSSLEHFIQNKIRGSKKFREILNKKRKNMAEKDIAKLTQVKSYANLTGTENIPITRVKCMLGGTIFFCQEKFALSNSNYITTA